MKFKLDPKKKKIWVNALRSGKYKQTQLELYSKYDKGYCCLGVARNCGLARQSSVNAGLLTFKFLPKKIQEKLSEMNDLHDWSFKRIANWIEKNL